MEKAKDGVTLIADAIRAEMAQAEKEKQTTTAPANVIDVTAQFTAKSNLGSVYGSTVNSTPPVTPQKADTGNVTPATPPADVSNNSDTSNKGNDDGTIYKNE